MKTYTIAEMAWSHTGSYKLAEEMLYGAYKAGVNAISIHITDMPTYMVKDYKCIAGTTLSDSADSKLSIYDYLDDINLSKDEWTKFSRKAEELMIDLIVMCNDQDSFIFSKELNVKKYVVSAASFLEKDLIRNIISYNKDIIIRTGGATLKEVDEILEFIYEIEASSKVCLLAGIQLYPTPINELHLNSLSELLKRYKRTNFSIGLADHIDGDHKHAKYLPPIAIALGAKVIEKHITTDRSKKLEDYEAALSIEQFKEFIEYIRDVEEALGSPSLKYMDDNESYKKYRIVGRKKIVAAKHFAINDVIDIDSISFKRSDYGSQLEDLNNLIGKKVIRPIKIDEGISLDDVL